MRWRGPRTHWRVVALGAAAVLLLTQPAEAFYWYGWPGSGVSPPATLVRTQVVVTPPPGGTTPSGPTPPGDTHPPGGTDTPPGVPTDPKSVPEPGTLLATGLGLAAVGLARRWRRNRAAA